jgi:predicted O-methyltransferase YrrM
MNNVKELLRCLHTGVRSFVLGANVASMRLLSRPRHAYLYWNACLFLRGSMGKQTLQKKNISQVFPELLLEAKLSFPELNRAWGWEDPSYLADLVHLGLLCAAVRPRTIFEIGTSTGYSSLFLAANSAPDVQIWTLDLLTGDATTTTPLTARDRDIAEWCHRVEPCFVGHALGRKIHRLYGDSASFDFAPYRRSIDLFFIDGAHTYEYVRLDTLNALRCCHPGSVIAWHDFGRAGLSRGVTRWLERLNRVAKVYTTPGSSIAFMPCDFDCEAVANRLGDKSYRAQAVDDMALQAGATAPRAVSR